MKWNGPEVKAVLKVGVVATVVVAALLIAAGVYLWQDVRAYGYVGMPLSWYQARDDYIVTDGSVGCYSIIDMGSDEVVTVDVDASLVITGVRSRISP